MLDGLQELDAAASPGPWHAGVSDDTPHGGILVQNENWEWLLGPPPPGGNDDLTPQLRVANARLAALSHHLLPLAKALETVCPMNGRGDCFMCGCGSIPDGEGIHADTDNVWGGDRPCFKSEFYADVRAVLAKLEEALGTEKRNG